MRAFKSDNHKVRRSASSTSVFPSAFTLVEILVVIGIIAILIGLLLPSLNRAREAAKTVQCAAQLRSVGQALAVYANNNRGFFPAWSGWQVANGDGTGEDSPGPGWTEQLGKGFEPSRSGIWHCPSFAEEYRVNYFLGSRYVCLSGRRSLKFSEIRLASQFVLSGDCTQVQLYPPAYGISPNTLDDCDKDDATQEGVVFAGQVGGINMHRGGNNVLFGDWHVDLFKHFDSGRMTYHPRKMQAWAAVTPE